MCITGWPARASLHDVNSVVVPPAQMVAHLQAGRIDGFVSAAAGGRPGHRPGQGFTLATSQSIWTTEKVLACARRFAEQYPNSAAP
jgi:nitrate/nitrite transport system substrate-binding protein